MFLFAFFLFIGVLTMGYYFDGSSSTGKGEELVGAHKGKFVDEGTAREAMAEGKGVFCILDNVVFEAAGFCFSEKEFEDFARVEDRQKSWVVIDDLEAAAKLAGYKRRG